MRKTDIKKMRTDIGKFLHEFYIKFGEDKYESFIKKLGSKMTKEYGEPFSYDNLRIMEAEFVTFNTKFENRDEDSDKTDITK